MSETSTLSSYDKKIVLVVDDTPENIDVLSGILRPTYKVKAAVNGERALKLAFGEPRPDLILLDIMMPGLDGYQVCQTLKSAFETRKIPIIFITAKATPQDEQRGLELGAVDYITKPVSPSIVMARVQTHLALSNQQRFLEEKVKARTLELEQTQLEIIRRLGRAAEYKDNETGLHVIRMSHYSRLLAEAVSDDASWSELIFNAAPMHDIGKIGIPDRILLKPAKLNAEEWDKMRRHPEYGANIIGDHPSDLMRVAKEIALTHHEKWDGSGYPKGLKGEEIGLSGRVVAVADVFDALTTKRPYKEAWSVVDAIRFIDENAGKHFDPNLVPLLHEVMPDVLDIKEAYGEETVSGGRHDAVATARLPGAA